jgi:ATP-dependent DNA ligase
VSGRVASGASARPPGSPLPGEPLLFQLPAPSPFPGRIRPEEAIPCYEAFDSPDWRFSVEWEGCRALLFLATGGSVRIQAATLADLTQRFSDVARAGSELLRRPAVLDGVVAVLDPTGKPDLPSLCLRAAAEDMTGATLPAVFLATDLLHLDGATTMGWPLDRRLETLGGLVESGSTIQVPDHVAGRGLALAEAAQARGLAGLLARRAGAPYRPGLASPDRLRIELAPRVTCVIAGVEQTRHSSAGRLVLAEQVAGRLVFAGRVDGPRDAVADGWLRRRLTELRSDSPMVDVAAESINTVWLRPLLCATVAHSGRDARGVLREPVLIAVRDDVDPAWCVRREPLPPPRDERGSAFLPTVLMPLPMDDTVLLPRLRG